MVPGSGQRHHDDRDHFIASTARRRTPLPVAQPHCRMAPKHSRCIACHAEIAGSRTAAASLYRRQSSSDYVLHHSQRCSRTPPGRQIAIVATACSDHRGFLPWRLSAAGPSVRTDSLPMGRHPKPYTQRAVPTVEAECRLWAQKRDDRRIRDNGRDAPKTDIHLPCWLGR